MPSRTVVIFAPEMSMLSDLEISCGVMPSARSTATSDRRAPSCVAAAAASPVSDSRRALPAAIHSDRAAVAAMVGQVQPDVVVHLAGIAFVGHSDVEQIYRVNVLGTRNLLEALAGAARKPSSVLLVVHVVEARRERRRTVDRTPHK